MLLRWTCQNCPRFCLVMPFWPLTHSIPPPLSGGTLMAASFTFGQIMYVDNGLVPNQAQLAQISRAKLTGYDKK